MPFYSPFAPAIFAALLPLIIVVALWTVAIKGYALWHAARGGQKGWFIALLVINTIGILEVVYLIWFRPGAPGASHTPAQHSSTQV
jgi:methionyl-tRNA synthetase